jgi:SAM-dependent methyltransferase
MLTPQEMVGFQAENHELIDPDRFPTKESYVLHLIHSAAYCTAAEAASNCRVLDIGCNTGYGTNIVFGSGPKEVIGVDISDKAIRAAQQRYQRPGMTFLKVDGERLPFEDGSFDLILGFQVIEHIVDHRPFFGELKRVLSTSGSVLLTTPNACLRLNPGMKPWYRFHVREFTPGELDTLLKAFFQQVSVRGLFASEPLYSIEFNRLDRARRTNADTTSIRARLKKTLPPVLRSSIKSLVGLLRKKNPPLSPDDSFIVKHSVEDFFYREDDLEKALDLMAVCSKADLHG